MGSAYIYYPVDFIFDAATTNIPVGGSAVIGSSANYYWRAQNTQSSSAFALDNESVAEVSGIEIFGPYVGNRRQKFRYVSLEIDGKETESIRLNELMAPGMIQGKPDPLAGAGFRFGHAAINLGMPLLAGGLPEEATPKIGPGETLNVRVQAELAANGGEALTQPMRVRVWLLQCKGEDKLRSLLEYYHGQGQGKTNLYNGGYLDCSFALGDLEKMDSAPIQTFEKRVGATGGFRLGDWTRLHGGNDCDKPKAFNYCTYAQNAAATTTNSWYQFTQDGTRVLESWQVLRWNFDKRDALKITHVGVQPHKNLRYIRLYRSGRSIENVEEVQIASNPFPLPAGKYVDYMAHAGPAKLPKTFFVRNEIGTIEAQDNGTSIPAWSASNEGVLVALYGKRYELVE